MELPSHASIEETVEFVRDAMIIARERNTQPEDTLFYMPVIDVRFIQATQVKA